MADGTPVTYEELPDELKKRYDEIKATPSPTSSALFREPVPMASMEGILTEGALDGIDLSPVGGTHRGLRQRSTTWWLTRYTATREPGQRVGACRSSRDPGDHEPPYSPSGPALGTHQGELPLQSRPPLPYALAAPPEVPATPAFVVYKIGGDPSDYQFLTEAPKEIPHGYACTKQRVGSSSLATQLKDMASQADYPRRRTWLKLSAYEQRHPDLYQDKFKRALVWSMREKTKFCGDQETEQIFDLLLKEKQLKIPEGLKFPTAQELNGKPYCKWHNSLSHATNVCRVWRQHIQAAIENGV
ncbi:hypothetical protein QYE76_040491 [Lolium multiflorum]|uniref:Uncharacterized protein n=1 Tax=Lolium multiflorum TaxID=4521 RepID=A0AAD8TDH9_LOLMU|nr:hypothetical protein QYE76_040491 [Lolium multiflorum]